MRICRVFPCCGAKLDHQSALHVPMFLTFPNYRFFTGFCEVPQVRAVCHSLQTAFCGLRLDHVLAVPRRVVLLLSEPLFACFFIAYKVENRSKNLRPFLCAPKSCFGVPGTAPRAPHGGSRRAIHWGPGRSKSLPTGSDSALLLSDSFCTFLSSHFGLPRTPFAEFLGCVGAQHHLFGTDLMLDRLIVPSPAHPQSLYRSRALTLVCPRTSQCAVWVCAPLCACARSSTAAAG